MKLSPKQIAASVAGAVAAAVMASLFGEKGTIIGVAIGSAVATMSTALVAQSIERTHHVVRQVVVGDAKRPAIFRRFGDTEPVGAVSSETTESPVIEPGGSPTGEGATGVEGTAAVIDRRSGVPDGRPEPVSATGRPVPPASPGPGKDVPGRRADGSCTIRWPVLAVSVGLVFVAALIVVTGVELIAGRPLSSLFGSSPASGGTSAGSLFTPSPMTMPPVTTTSTTTMPATSTTTTVLGTSTTTMPATSTTTTPGQGTTSTTGTNRSTTTTNTTTTTSTTTTTTTTSTGAVTAPSTTTTSP